MTRGLYSYNHRGALKTTCKRWNEQQQKEKEVDKGSRSGKWESGQWKMRKWQSTMGQTGTRTNDLRGQGPQGIFPLSDSRFSFYWDSIYILYIIYVGLGAWRQRYVLLLSVYLCYYYQYAVNTCILLKPVYCQYTASIFVLAESTAYWNRNASKLDPRLGGGGLLWVKIPYFAL